MSRVFSGARSKVIGILREVKNKWERRTPLSPSDVEKLVKKNVKVLVQPSSMRIFKDQEFKKAGAILTEDLNEANTIFGVKEFPKENIIENKSYMIFSHVIKAQPYNMPFLDEILRRKARLFDYETVRALPSAGGGRLIAFGKFAGLAGMIDILRGTGERLLSLGYSSSFMSVSSAYMYPDLAHAKAAVTAAGNEIRQYGLPEGVAPFKFIFTGTGNVAQGAQEIFELLPHKWVTVEELANLPPDPHVLYGCVVTAKDMVKHRLGQPFDKQQYYKDPSQYEPIFHQTIAPHTNVLVNCMYWDPRFPRLITNPQMKALEETYTDNRKRKFMALADITCDIEGSVEFLKRSSTIDQPFFMYNPLTDTVSTAIEGRGVLVLGVDNLPAEFPKDASAYFSQALANFVEPLSMSDPSQPFATSAASYLPAELVNSCIAADGKLTPSYEYIFKLRAAQEHAASTTQASSFTSPSSPAGSVTCSVLLEGHLFDTGFINQALDLFEKYGTDFAIKHWLISPNRADRANNLSRAVIGATFESKQKKDELFQAVTMLALKSPASKATIAELEFNHQTKMYTSQSDKSISFAAPDEPIPVQSKATPTSTPSMSISPPTAASKSNRKILVLGSGFVAGPLVEYLQRHSDNLVTVASHLKDEAENLARPFQATGRVNAVKLNIKEASKLRGQIESHDIVVSLLPAAFHPEVLSPCIELRKSLVTASYVSPAMAELGAHAESAGITVLNEMGLDPGIDHMSAMAVIQHVQQQGGKITSFQSLCGGLPAPECTNNPFAYKFSWSPLGMLLATQNNAVYRRDGNLVQIPSSQLLTSAQPFDFNPAFRLEHYPNRDSLSYAGLYGIPDVQSMYRGTIRYEGTAKLLHGYARLGLLDRKIIELPKEAHWPALLCQLWSCSASSLRSTIHAQLTKLPEFDQATIQRVISSFEWLGLFSERELLVRSSVISASQYNPLELLCAILQEKLTYSPGERDMVLMAHEFGITLKDGQRMIQTSSLVSYGGDDPHPPATVRQTGGGGGRLGYSAMARTVGIPAAIGVQMILDKQIGTGMKIPTHKSIYEPTLKKLEDEGISFVEKTVLVN